MADTFYAPESLTSKYSTLKDYANVNIGYDARVARDYGRDLTTVMNMNGKTDFGLQSTFDSSVSAWHDGGSAGPWEGKRKTLEALEAMQDKLTKG